MRIVFMGTPQAAVPTLERIVRDGHEVVAVYTQPDRPSGRGQKVAISSVKQFAIDHEISVRQPTTLRNTEVLDAFKSHNADVAVVVAYGRILPESFLTAFPKGAVNVHFSLLPKFRGSAPVNWAIANGETVTGVTTMRMDAGLDTGDILLQRETPIGDEETSPELMDRLSVMGAEILAETLISWDEIEPKKQDDSRATLAPILKKEDGLIDWSMGAATISNRIRGFQPFPSSYTFRRGQRLTIWKGKAVTDVTLFASKPGTAIKVSATSFAVACSRGTALEVLALQPENKRRMTASEYLNGATIEPGEVFGDKNE